MEIKEIVKEIEKEKKEKVSINLVIPKDYKIKFDALCKSMKTTPTAVLNKFIEKSVIENEY